MSILGRLRSWSASPEERPRWTIDDDSAPTNTQPADAIGSPIDAERGLTGRPVDSSKFTSNANQLAVMQRGQAIWRQTGSCKVQVVMGREIGEGYRRHAASRDDVFWTNRAVVLLNDDGTIFNAFPILRT